MNRISITNYFFSETSFFIVDQNSHIKRVGLKLFNHKGHQVFHKGAQRRYRQP